MHLKVIIKLVDTNIRDTNSLNNLIEFSLPHAWLTRIYRLVNVSYYIYKPFTTSVGSVFMAFSETA